MVKKLINSLREYKKSTILTPICLIMEVLMECSIPFILAKLIDEGISHGDRNVIINLGLLLLVAAFRRSLKSVEDGGVL